MLERLKIWNLFKAAVVTFRPGKYASKRKFRNFVARICRTRAHYRKYILLIVPGNLDQVFFSNVAIRSRLAKLKRLPRELHAPRRFLSSLFRKELDATVHASFETQCEFPQSFDNLWSNHFNVRVAQVKYRRRFVISR